MKKIFASLAVAALSLSAYAADFSYTADPTPGTVQKLDVVTVSFPQFEEVEFMDKGSVTVTRNGSPVSGVTVANTSYGSNAIKFTFAEPQTAAGTYNFNLPTGCFCGYDAEYNPIDLDKDLTISYIIAGGTPTFDFTADPAAGEVTEISTVKLTFAAFDELDIPTAGDLTVARDGNALTGYTVAVQNKNNVVFTFKQPQTAAGIYTFSIPEGGLDGFKNNPDTEEMDYYSLDKAISLEYTIKGTSAVDLSFTADPADNAVLEKLGKITLTLPNVELAGINESTVTVNGEELGRREVTTSYDANVITFTFTPEITTPGKVVVSIPPTGIMGMKGEEYAENEEEITLNYTIAAPVVYTLALNLSSPTKPNADGQISAERQLESFFFNVESKGIAPLATTDEKMMVTIKEVNGDFEASAYLTKAFGLNSNYSYFSAAFGKQPVYNGEYVITIPQGVAGDEVWVANQAVGVANAATELRFTLADGKDRATFDLAPLSITPEAGKYDNGSKIATVTVTFPAGTEMAEGAIASLAGVDNTYTEQASFVKKSDGVFEAVFSPAPTVDGNYRLEVAAGAFGDAAFFGGENGHGSQAINVDYTVGKDVGVDGIEAENAPAAGVYNMMGIRVAERPEGLPAGLYIYGGKKIVIRK